MSGRAGLSSLSHTRSSTYAAPAFPIAACVAAQNTADAICQRGSDTTAGFSAGSEISSGLTCLAAQRIADDACKK